MFCTISYFIFDTSEMYMLKPKITNKVKKKVFKTNKQANTPHE